MQAVYFQEIFGKYLKERIPVSAKNLTYDSDGKLDKSYRKISKEMLSMIRECGYFKYVNNEFYYELGEMVKNLDEKLVILAGKKIKDREQQQKEIVSIHREIESIVKFINQEYHKY